MKLSAAAYLAALCYSVHAVTAAEPRVYVYDTAPLSDHSTHAADLSPLRSRLVLAQRIGVEKYHYADLNEEGVIDAINDFGVRTPLFADVSPERSVIVLESEADIETSIPWIQEYSHFTISPSPSREASQTLLTDLFQQRIYDVEHKQGTVGTWYNTSSTKDVTQRWTTLLEQSIRDTAELGVAHSITLVILPPSGKGSGGDSPYGSYAMPGMESQLRKRQFTFPEEPLEDDSLLPVSQSYDYVSDLMASNQSEPLPGVFGSCFTSLASCERLTRNCTGHGSCYKKYTNNDAADASPYKDCYTCQCVATTSTTSGGGKKTTYWGGSACQKRDVSVQFWLLALFTVGLVFLVSFAIGQIWTMGDEQLPSVIGAGVSGPPRRG